MAAILEVFDAVAISADDLTRLLAAVRFSLDEVKEKRSHLSDDELVSSADQLSKMIDAPALDVKHKLKLTLPIIPFLLDYEGEIELNSRLNLERAWGAFGGLLLRRPNHMTSSLRRRRRSSARSPSISIVLWQGPAPDRRGGRLGRAAGRFS